LKCGSKSDKLIANKDEMKTTLDKLIAAGESIQRSAEGGMEFGFFGSRSLSSTDPFFFEYRGWLSNVRDSLRGQNLPSKLFGLHVLKRFEDATMSRSPLPRLYVGSYSTTETDPVSQPDKFDFIEHLDEQIRFLKELKEKSAHHHSARITIILDPDEGICSERKGVRHKYPHGDAGSKIFAIISYLKSNPSSAAGRIAAHTDQRTSSVTRSIKDFNDVSHSRLKLLKTKKPIIGDSLYDLNPFYDFV
jgi:hypothetical protein